ncbi:MAG: creatininase family protein [Spirochaetaceae bacterium]|jgi:creatinine amidohydrolase|nr:creatininase family protein [Spirochaetaceae bacterium]
MKKSVLIEDLSWTEFAGAIAQDNIIILPVGSTEEHGPQSPLGTDFFIARALARSIGEKAQALVAPAIPIGNAQGLLDFPGTISIDPVILADLVFEVCENFIRHGAGRFFFVNGHGGNNGALRHAASALHERYGVFVAASEWWTLMPKISEYQAHDHGGKFETSMMMAINESIVDLTKADTKQMEKLTDNIAFDYGFFYRGAAVSLNLPTSMITPRGNFGAPSEEARREIGEAMFEIYTDYCAGLIREIRQIPDGRRY